MKFIVCTVLFASFITSSYLAWQYHEWRTYPWGKSSAWSEPAVVEGYVYRSRTIAPPRPLFWQYVLGKKPGKWQDFEARVERADNQ